MNDVLTYLGSVLRRGGSTLAVFLLLIASGRAQEKDPLVIHFDFARSSLRPEARAAIDSLMSYYSLGSHSGPSLPPERIVLSGHCDGIGGNVFNDRLSLARIRATRDYLRSKGLADSLFSAMNAYGKRRPLNDNGDADKRSLNRRVEIAFYPAPAVGSRDRNASSPSPPLSPLSPLSPASPDFPQQAAPPLTLTEFLRDSARTGKTYVLRNLNFISGRHVLMPYSDTVLKELLRIMLDNPGLKIEIRGHVCCIAEWLDGLDSDTNTNDLSVRRARFVYTYLRQGGVKASRMSYRGFGAGMKLYPEERNEQEQEWNRRVEIRVIDR
jgi:outer membrane protein OmpA-like peptidoglycan-associated protein